MKVEVVFDEHAGYDAMSAAYLLLNEQGGVLAKIDLAEWLHAVGVPEPIPYNLRHSENDAARLAAETMAHALDERWRLVAPGYVLVPESVDAKAMHLVVTSYLAEHDK